MYFTLNERIYQDEFYRSCFLIALRKCHPDVGAIYGSAGYLDFYIHGDIRLGFELLRNGVKINGHLDRFDPVNGIYKDIPLHDYAVLDFYQGDTFDGSHFNGEKYFAAVFSADFSSIQLWHNGIAEEPLIVQIHSSREASTVVSPFPPNAGAVSEGLLGSDYPEITFRQCFVTFGKTGIAGGNGVYGLFPALPARFQRGELLCSWKHTGRY
jgi:hypothetical protein